MLGQVVLLYILHCFVLVSKMKISNAAMSESPPTLRKLFRAHETQACSSSFSDSHRVEQSRPPLFSGVGFHASHIGFSNNTMKLSSYE